MKKLLVLLTTLVTTASQADASKTRYVTDDLELYTRSGPTAEFRIVGRVKTGQKVSLLEVNEQTQFSKIQTDDNKSFWIENKFISATESAKEKLRSLEQQSKEAIRKAEEKLKTAERQIEQNQALLAQVEALSQEISELQKENEVLTQQNSTYKSQFLAEFFFAGGIVAIIGSLFGFLISKYGGKKRRNLF